ncbi:ankyrin repeat protein [Histomonas meleagridis]|uniref:ankyrin repeat protein n=1 Tax=Histomonas meleagridis TaxID=135588 RepID=UPI003559853C|nr:ankyrin repeat protein [Histomonas meleagridis]KAH0806860.1 ankyrin repeat protein [Histomonas meleagridis]
MILNFGVDICKYECTQEKEIHPLCFACKKGFFRVVKTMLENGVNPDSFYYEKKHLKYSAIEVAAICDKPNIVNLLLKYNPSKKNIAYAYQEAKQMRHKEVVEIIKA